MPLKPHTSTPRPHISHPAQDADLLLPSWYRDLAEACWSADPSQRPSVSKILEGLAAQVWEEEGVDLRMLNAGGGAKSRSAACRAGVRGGWYVCLVAEVWSRAYCAATRRSSENLPFRPQGRLDATHSYRSYIFVCFVGGEEKGRLAHGCFATAVRTAATFACTAGQPRGRAAGAVSRWLDMAVRGVNSTRAAFNRCWLHCKPAVRTMPPQLSIH
eukprot:355521-Chlamydomonas_euryale.AAC.6